MPDRPPLSSFFSRPPLSSFFRSTPDPLEDEEERKAEARRLREERMRELAAGGNLPTAELDQPDEAKPLDHVRRMAAAMFSNVSGPLDLEETIIRRGSPVSVLPKPLQDAVVRATVEPAREVLRRGENALSGLIPVALTTPSQERERERYRALDKPAWLRTAAEIALTAGNPLLAKAAGPGLGEAGIDAGLELAGSFLDPVAAGLGAAKAAKAAGLGAAAERRVATGLRSEVDALLPTLAGKTRAQLAEVLAKAEPGSALEKAVEVAARQLEVDVPEAAGKLTGYYARPKGASVPAAATPDVVAAKAAEFRARVAARQQTPRAPASAIPVEHPTVATAKKLEPPDVPFEFNAARLNLSQEHADELLSTIKEHLPEIEAQRRAGQGGFDKFAAPERLAARLGMTKEKLLKTKAGTVFNDEEMAVLDSTLGGVSAQISDLSKKIATGTAPELARAELAKLQVEYGSLLRVSIGAGTEAGRSLGALRAFKKAMALPDRARVAVLRKYGEAVSDDMLHALATIDNPDDMASFLRKLDQPKVGSLVHEAYISSLVSGLGSQERNLLGNSVMALSEQASRTVRRTAAAAGDVIRSAATGAPREHFFGEATAGWVGMGHGFRRGLAKAAIVFRKGYDPATPLDEFVGKFAQTGAFARHPNAGVRALGMVLTPPLRALSAVDAFYKTIGFTSEQYALATKAALRSGKRGPELAAAITAKMDDPEILEAAGKYAASVTLTDAPSKITQKFLGWRDAVPGGRFIAPFVKIADRLLVKGFEYTPVGAVRGMRQMAAGATQEGADLLARSAIGSTVMLGVAGMASEGNLTAWAPKDGTERERFYAAQKQPWSMKIGNRWVPYGQLEPFATPIAMVAAARQAYEESGELPPADVALHVSQALAQRTLDASYMDSIQSLFEAMSSDERAVDKLAKVAAGVATGVAVPYSGAVRGAAVTQDPRYVKPEGFWENVAAGIPWLREKLPSQIDRWGEEQQMVGGSARGYLATGTPLLSTEEKTDPVDEELARLGIDVGHVGRSVEGFRLGDDDYRKLQTEAGRAQREAAERVMALDGYDDRPPEAQRKLLERAIESSRDRARAQFRRENRDLFAGYRRARRSAAELGSLARGIKKTAAAGRAGVAEARESNSVLDILEAKKRAKAEQQQAWGAAAGELATAAAAMRREGYSEAEARKWLLDALRENGIARKDAALIVQQLDAGGG